MQQVSIKNKALLFASIIFLIMAFIQLGRLLYPFSIMISGYEIPLWASGLGFIIWALCAAITFRALGHKEPHLENYPFNERVFAQKTREPISQPLHRQEVKNEISTVQPKPEPFQPPAATMLTPKRGPSLAHEDDNKKF